MTDRCPNLAVQRGGQRCTLSFGHDWRPELPRTPVRFSAPSFEQHVADALIAAGVTVR